MIIEPWMIVAVIGLAVLLKFIPGWFKSAKRKKYERRLSRSGMDDVDLMDGFEFEVYLKKLFQKLGYNAEVTSKSGDFGADVVLKGKNKIVIQAKRYGYGNKVGIKAVQEVYAAKAYYMADEAWVLTNSIFTEPAKELAVACGVKLLDRENLAKFIEEIEPKRKTAVAKGQKGSGLKPCKCGKGNMVVRETKLEGDKFLGCSTFPKCRHTERI